MSMVPFIETSKSPAYAAAIQAQEATRAAQEKKKAHLRNWIDDTLEVNKSLGDRLCVKSEPGYPGYEVFKDHYWVISPARPMSTYVGMGFGLYPDGSPEIHLILKENEDAHGKPTLRLCRAELAEDYSLALSLVYQKLEEIHDRDLQAMTIAQGASSLFRL